MPCAARPELAAEVVLALGTTMCGMTSDHLADACAERAAVTGRGGLVICNLQQVIEAILRVRAHVWRVEHTSCCPWLWAEWWCILL